MRLTKFLPILVLFVGAVAFTSCKKEAKIERNMHKNGGEWSITNYSYSSVTTNSQNSIDISADNCGTMTFNKDGSGSYVLNIFGTETGVLTYVNTEDQLTLTIDGSTTIYDLTWEKDNITIVNVETSQNNGETTTETETYVLVKK